MTLLLPHRPFRRPSSETTSICRHKAPGTIDKPSDDFNRTGIEVKFSSLLGLLKGLLICLTVAVFTPAPILHTIFSKAIYHELLLNDSPFQLDSTHNGI